MSGVIDTNLLLYSINRDAVEYNAARSFLEKVATSADSYYLTEGILYEFLRVSTHHRVFAFPLSAQEAWSFLKGVLYFPSIEILGVTKNHWKILEGEIGQEAGIRGNLFFDARTYIQMKEQGIKRIYTMDHDFKRFSDIEVVNPLSP